MTAISIHSNLHIDFTLLSNVFVDRYMPAADGEFVKIYIYLLRSEQAGRQVWSLASVADALSCTESLVLRALLYWEKQGLLTLSHSNGDVTEIALRIPCDEPAAIADADTVHRRNICHDERTTDRESAPQTANTGVNKASSAAKCSS